MEYQRSPAIPCTISELKKARFIKQTGWDPSYVITEYNKIFRVDIMGILISKQDSIIIDDGAQIIVKNFTNTPINAEIGDLVRVIGKPRLFNNEIFINLEILKKIKNKDWLKFRKKQLSLRKKQDIIQEEYIDDGKQETQTKETLPEPDDSLNKIEVILKLVSELDNGDGADYDELIKKAGFNDAEKVLSTLIEEGEVFQIKPGKLKIL